MKPQRFWALESWTGAIVYVATEAQDRVEAETVARRRREHTGRDYQVVRVEVRVVTPKKRRQRKARKGAK